VAYLSFEDDPCFIFIDLLSIPLIEEFGREITIKTDCDEVLPKKDDYDALVELRVAIFEALKISPEFQHEKWLRNQKQNRARKSTL